MAGVFRTGFVADGEDVAGQNLIGTVNSLKATLGEYGGVVVAGEWALGAKQHRELALFEVVGM